MRVYHFCVNVFELCYEIKVIWFDYLDSIFPTLHCIESWSCFQLLQTIFLIW